MWYGGVIWRRSCEGRARDQVVKEYRVEWDERREQWELPKGGHEEHSIRKTTRMVDKNAWQTVRWEVFEEAGLWISWRELGTYVWMADESKPANGWLVTELQPGDIVDESHPSWACWMTSTDFHKTLKPTGQNRGDHLRLMRKIDPLYL